MGGPQKSCTPDLGVRCGLDPALQVIYKHLVVETVRPTVTLITVGIWLSKIGRPTVILIGVGNRINHKNFEI